MHFCSLLGGMIFVASLISAVLTAGGIPPSIYKIDSLAIPVNLDNTSVYHKRSPPFDQELRRLDRRVNHNGQPPNHEYYFDQRISHNKWDLGTFKQRYFFNDEHWGGKGYPIIVTTSGQNAADEFWQQLTANSLVRAMMIKFRAAGVVLEHRYYGNSSPYNVLSAENMTFLTLDQSIEDIRNFVKNVNLPWAESAGINSTDPDFAPWVHIGCGYAGLLAAYTQQKYPNLFAASWASSAPIQADLDFWEYYSPIEEGMPKNCSKDAGKVVKYVDSVIGSGNTSNIVSMKSEFGLQDTRDDDFAQSIVRVLWTWTTMQPYSFNYSGYDMFYKFCDALETNADGTLNYLGNGIGLPQAYLNYAAFFKKWYSDPYCPGGACYSTYDYNSPVYKDQSVRNYFGRQWLWFICNEFGWLRTGDPGNGSKIASRYITVDYHLRICSHTFPKADGSLINYQPDVNGNNERNRGWNLKAPRLFVINGEFDPWRSASLCSKYGPPCKSVKDYQKVVMIKGAHHCWDWSLWNAELNQDVEKAVNVGLKQLQSWLRVWYIGHPMVDKPAEIVPGLNKRVSDSDDGDEAMMDVSMVGSNEDSSNTSIGLNVILILALLTIALLSILYRWRRDTAATPSWARYFVVDEDQLGDYGPYLVSDDRLQAPTPAGNGRFSKPINKENSVGDTI